MPELPEVEITARRLSRAAAGAQIESALAPGMVTMKTFDPPLDALAGRTLDGVRRIGKMLAIEAGDLVLLIHLMSAGRLQLWDKRASLRDRASRILVRLADGRELRLREFGTQQRAWGKLLAADAVEADEAVATLGPDAYPAPPAAEFARLLDQPRHLHPLLRDQRVIAGIGRSWVDELLWTARLSPFQKGSDLDAEALRAAARRLRRRARRGAGALRAGARGQDPRQAADAAEGAPPSGRGLPALRHAHRGDSLQGLRDVLLPRGADGRARAQGPPSLAAAEMSRAAEQTNRRLLRARDAMDRDYSKPLDIAALAKIAIVSEAHFIRTFRQTFGETPHRYLQRRRVERAMALLRQDELSVTEVCLEVGFSSLGTFSRTFSAIVGQSPAAYRRGSAPLPVPTCFVMGWTRPSSFGEAKSRGAA